VERKRTKRSVALITGQRGENGQYIRVWRRRGEPAREEKKKKRRGYRRKRHHFSVFGRGLKRGKKEEKKPFCNPTVVKKGNHKWDNNV